jgi:hypothetical protein
MSNLSLFENALIEGEEKKALKIAADGPMQIPENEIN